MSFSQKYVKDENVIDFIKRNINEIHDQTYWKELIIPTNAGWATSNAGSGGVTQAPLYLFVFTGITASSRGQAYTYTLGLNSGDIGRYLTDWTKKLELEFLIVRLNNDPECVARIQLKESYNEGALSQRGIGINIANYAVVGEAYGTARGTVSLGTIPDDRVWRVKIVKTNEEVQFWVNGVLMGTLTGNAVPKVRGTIDTFLVVSIINGTTGGVSAYFFVSNIRIRQEW